MNHPMLQKDFFSSFTHPASPAWKDALNAAANQLFVRLQQLDVNALPISEYSRRYFSDYLRRLHYGMECGCYLLAHAFPEKEVRPEQLILCDYGGGTGMLSLLARAAGIGTVCYVDIVEDSGKDARTLAAALGLEAHEYLTGEAEVLRAWAEKNGKTPHAVISRNVVEHIYDLKAHLQVMHRAGVKLVYATTANPANLLTDVYTRRLQRKAEWQGHAGRWKKEGDIPKSFFEIRKELLREAYPGMSEREVVTLGKASRGLIKEDMFRMADAYVQTGKVLAFTRHPTNTCNPLNGNRVEHLMEEEEYLSVYHAAGYECTLVLGFYDTHYGNSMINRFTFLLNVLLRNRGSRGKYLAPFVTFVAHPG